MKHQVTDKAAGRGGALCLLLATSFYMCSSWMSAALPQIAAAFPHSSMAQVQMMMMSPGIMTALTTFAQKPLLRRFSREQLVKAGLVLYLAAGLGGALFHQHLLLLVVWNALMGLATGGLIAPMAASLLSETPEPRRRALLLGLWSASLNLGGAVIGLLGGWLNAWLPWQSCFGINLLALPVWLACVRFLPAATPAAAAPSAPAAFAGAGDGGPARRLPLVVGLSFLFSLFYFVALPNLSLFVGEQGYGTPLLAGAGTACLMVGGGISGVLYGRLFGLLGRLAPALGCGLLGAGYLCMVLGHGQPVLFLAGTVLVGLSHGFVIPYFSQRVSEMGLGRRQTLGITLTVTALPALASFLSPLLFTQLGAALGMELAWQRFAAAAAGAFVLAAVLAFGKGARRRA